MRHTHLGDGAGPTPGRPAGAVLLLSHGSRDPRASYVVAELSARVASRTGGLVHDCHLDFVPPAPDVALQELAERGVGRVRVVPLLFAAGFHVRVDVPAAVAASGVADRVELSVAPPLIGETAAGRELLLAGLVERLAQAGQLDAINGVVLAAAGSSCDTAREQVASLARDLGDRLFCPSAAAYAAGPGPRPADAVQALRGHGATRPAVASLFVAPGRLPDSVVQGCQDVPVADPLGVTPAFVDLLVDLSAAAPLRS